MAKMILGLIKNIEMLKESICRIDFESKELAQESLPGQFVNIRCGDGITPLLRRPISICDVDKNSDMLTIVFQIKAAGTRLLSKLQIGDELDVLGPLGKGFDLSPKYENVLVVGGGIGVFPLLFLLKESPAKHKSAILGFRNKALAVMEDEFKSLVSKDEKEYEIDRERFKVFTDDGSYGKKGLVVNGLTEYIKASKIELVYACGPTIMLKNVAKAVKEAGAMCQLSVEQRMGCGIGACLVCACKAKVVGSSWGPTTEATNGATLANTTKDQEGNFVYKHVCKDGPVFWADDLVFDE